MGELLADPSLSVRLQHHLAAEALLDGELSSPPAPAPAAPQLAVSGGSGGGVAVVDPAGGGGGIEVGGWRVPNSVAEAPNSPPPLGVCEGGGKDMAARPLPARCNLGRKNDASIPAKQRVVTGHRGGGRGCGRGQLKKGLVLAAPPTPRGVDAASQQPPTGKRSSGLEQHLSQQILETANSNILVKF